MPLYVRMVIRFSIHAYCSGVTVILTSPGYQNSLFIKGSEDIEYGMGVPNNSQWAWEFHQGFAETPSAVGESRHALTDR